MSDDLIRISSEYQLEVRTDKMAQLLAAEVEMDSADFLHAKLLRIRGVNDVDYNGHFGPYVTVTLHSKYDTEETRAQICATVAEHLQECADA